MRTCNYAISELLPHGPPMVLLDKIIRWDQGYIEASLTIRPDIPFFAPDKGGTPSYVGLEYMAQTCGAYAGLEGLSMDQPVRIGFLLGTRNYHANVDWFKSEDQLTITARELFRQDGMGVFDCRIFCKESELASAQLSLYRPESAASNLENV